MRPSKFLAAAALTVMVVPASLRGADTRVGDITVIEADAAVLQPGELFDLNGKTVTLTPKSGGGYTSTVGPVNYDSAIGNKLAAAGDDTSINMNIGFSFPFFGLNWSSIWVNSNGHLTFGANSSDWHFYTGDVNRLSSGSDLSGILDLKFASLGPRIAILWQDWNPAAGGGIYISSRSDRMVITWNGVPLYNTSTVPVTATFQAILFNSGVIQLNYQSVSATPTGGYLTGISPGGLDEFEVTTVDFSQGGESISAFRFFEPLAQVFGSHSAPLVHINAVARKFFGLNPDSTDQIVMFANFTHAMGSAFAFELTARQTVAGIGQGAPDTSTGISTFFGSGGNLLGFLNMNRLGLYPADPNARFLGTDSTLSIMGQESGHQWLAFFRYDDGAVCNTGLLGRDQAHWSFFMDSDASDMEGNDWRDNGNGTFISIDATSRYSLLDQYAMGLVPASGVPGTFWIQNPVVTNPQDGRSRTVESSPENNVTASGTRVNVSIGQISGTRCNGARSPASGFSTTNPTNQWRQSFVLLIRAGTAAPQNDLTKIETIRTAWTSYFAAAVDGRGSVNSSSASSAPAAPSDALARVCFGAKVNVAWTDNSGDESAFKLERKTGASGNYAEIASLGANTTHYLDTGLAAGTTYYYRVRSSNGAGSSQYSAETNASTGATPLFTDNPLVAANTPIKEVHMNELRSAVNAMRSCAGLASSSWTDSTLAGVPVKAVHLQELRDGLNQALTALGSTLPSYSDNPPSAAVTVIKAAHLQELRQAVQ